MKLPRLSKPERNDAQDFFCPIFFGTSDNAIFSALMKIAAERVRHGHFVGDNLFTWGKNNSMLDDQAFMKAWSSNLADQADQAILWRRYVLACAAFHCVHLDGDFVECGCYLGVGVKTVADYLGGIEFPKQFWAYDLFEHTPGMRHHAMPEHGPELYGRIRKKFSPYPQVKVIKGEIPCVFAANSPQRICYLHLDLNEPDAELAALESLFDRIVPGGMLILDDYEWAMNYRRQKLAEDPWFEARGYRVIPIPTGQGLVIKR
ncbi:MAG: TylF/MycF/NovP-related O-methyltransferase [Tepidisphaeraceae bacterium]|jgi:O-methyltransferase